MTDQRLAAVRGVLHKLGPVVIAALMFTISDVSARLALDGGSDILTILTFRSMLGIALVFVWLRVAPTAARLTPRTTMVALGLGVLFTLNLFGVFKAIELIPVSIAILTYFIYPLLTGLIGAATGLDRVTWKGFAAAIVAFGGLALIIGANPADLAAIGLLAAVGGAVCRVAMLLITRATLAGADARLVTWYTLWSSMLVFAVLSVATWNWHWPQTPVGWGAFIAIGVTTTVAMMTLYVSTQRIGPFRTALFMNLEPLMTALLSAAVLGDRLSPLQLLGGAVMLTALCAFQLRR